MRKLSLVVPILALAAQACATTFQKERWETKPVTENDARQSHGEVTIERSTILKREADMVEAECEPGTDLSFKQGSPTVEKWRITNGTSHIIRLATAVVKLFDPQENPNELVVGEEARHKAEVALSCTHLQKSVRFFDKNIEILPNSTWSGYAVFDTSAHPNRTLGTWKFGIYEMPVETDAVGAVTKTAKFEFSVLTEKAFAICTKPAFGKVTCDRPDAVNW